MNLSQLKPTSKLEIHRSPDIQFCIIPTELLAKVRVTQSICIFISVVIIHLIVANSGVHATDQCQSLFTIILAASQSVVRVNHLIGGLLPSNSSSFSRQLKDLEAPSKVRHFDAAASSRNVYTTYLQTRAVLWSRSLTREL